MKKLIIFICFSVVMVQSLAQNNALILDGGIITLSDNVILSIDQDHASGIERLSTGYIVSELEGNKIHWKIANQTGNYLLPFGHPGGDYIPLQFTIDIVGSGAGFLEASTYGTGANNLPWPAGVTHLNNNYSNNPNGANTNDRFWILNTNSYVVPPAVTIQFTYRDAENQAPNTIIENELFAQRFNSNTNEWGDWAPGGQITNTINNTVSNSSVPSAQYYSVWALAGLSEPLPVELYEFTGECTDEGILLSWTTLSEVQNDYFEVYKSEDGINFKLLGKVSGDGNSTDINNYAIADQQVAASECYYYRLDQTDFNGQSRTLQTIRKEKCITSVANSFELLSADPDALFISAMIAAPESIYIQLTNLAGQILYDSKSALDVGSQTLKLETSGLSSGVYFIRINSAFSTYSEKFFLR